VLASVAGGLAPQGRVIVLELTLPRRGSWLKRAVARLDRGRSVRPYDEWTRIFEHHFTVAETRLFELRFLGAVPLWDMVFYRLCAKVRGG
jgi:hypothetical protein